jgi:membrane-bound lytic murein transglycosylase D
MNKIQEFSSSGVGQQELAKLRKAVSDLEARLAGLESRLAEQMEAGAGTEAEAGGGSSDDVKRHTVQQGETLFSIGQRYGVSVEKLRKWNDIGTNEFIHPGQELKVAQ